MGIRQYWIRIALVIGFDNFLAMWRVLDSDPSLLNESELIEVSLRPYRSYLRFQRNRYIETLTKMGLTAAEIRMRIDQELCEKLSDRHITRIMTGR